jgi:hypothetical protein
LLLIFLIFTTDFYHRIVTALRIIRAIAKAAALAKRLSEKKGKKWVGHIKSVTSFLYM